MKVFIGTCMVGSFAFDSKGKIIHIQDSGLLEEGSGYNKQKVTGFFKNWTAMAVLPKKAQAAPATGQTKR